ncbi:MAG TPA: AAA family ATPase [Ardenticatenaceae bacterium]|jgi:predicted ATPase
MNSQTIHLKAVSLRRMEAEEAARFPFSIPAIHSLERIEFASPVTFLVGENGSGKSTLLEAIAAAAGATTAGSESAEDDPTLSAARSLARHLRLSWQRRSRKGFFLRAEDFFGYVKRLAQIRAGLEHDLKELEAEYEGRSELALNLARTPFLRELHELEHRYGGDLDSFSHGESFLQFFQARFVPDGLYLLDEPEAPLSPARQLAFLSMLKQMVEQKTQFIIATHSPIIMAFPGATILSFDAPPIHPVTYGELEHVTITRAFLNSPERFLKHL